MTFEGIIIPVICILICGIIVGLILTICAKVFEVKIDEKIVKVREALPGINCGVCGFSGCDDYAKNIIENGTEINKCIPGGDKSAKEISAILDVEFMDVTEKTAFVKCNGNCKNVVTDFIYNGIKTCTAANLFFKGDKSCKFGCIGFGDFVEMCEYDAINIKNGIAVINENKCIGCGLCAKSCPKNIISIKNLTQSINVACNSLNNGKTTKLSCKVGCIGCKLCVKACPNNAIIVENNLAHINSDKCTLCGKCITICPQNCIINIKSNCNI